MVVFNDAEYRKIVANLPRACIDLIIEYQGKVLSVRRQIKPMKGKFYIPGGAIKHGETIKQAALRIATLETNLSCAFISIAGCYEGIFGRNEVGAIDHSIGYICHLVADTDVVTLDFQHDEYKWVDKIELALLDLGCKLYKQHNINSIVKEKLIVKC